MADLSLADYASGRVIVERLEVADGFWTRLVGLQFRKSLAAGCGLLIVPCSAVHTFWMRFAIDLVGISRDGDVVAIKRNLKPWRIAVLSRGAYAILELPAGAMREIRVGDKLCLLGSAPRASLQFLRKTPNFTA